MEERNNINSFRKKRARRKFIFRLAVVVLFVLVVVLIVINWSKIISPLKDAALDVGEGGFPVELPGSAGYTLEGLGDNFYLLTDTYIYTYNGEGALITDIQHGFQNPVSDSNNKRIVVYDKNGKEFDLYSRSHLVYEKALEDSIVFASIGNDDRCAVVTTSTRYSNYLYVFNGEGEQIFRWASPDYKIMQVEFSDDDKSIFVTALGSKGGDLQLYLIRFDLDNAESHIWQSYVGADISYSIDYCSDGIYVVTDGGCTLFDSVTGANTAISAFNKTVSMLPDNDQLRTVVFRDPASSGDVISVYGSGLENSAVLYVDNLTDVYEADGRCYVLSGSQLFCYNSSLEPVKTYELDDVYSDVIVMNGYAYLLGYNVVQRTAL
ncbi:MAG: hypothetical protein IJO91_06760 [Oscillospiraceae bacterium]|nr:hypothetical protein [Oscillospiraceae bacterium]